MTDRQAARSHRARQLIALTHLHVAAAGIAVVLVLLYTGTRPDAELGGGFAVAGGLLAFPVVAFAAAAVGCARSQSTAPQRSTRLSLVLGWVELVTALVLAWAACVAAASYSEFAPWRSPVGIPALLLGAAGAAAVSMTGRALRRSRAT